VLYRPKRAVSYIELQQQLAFQKLPPHSGEGASGQKQLFSMGTPLLNSHQINKCVGCDPSNRYKNAAQRLFSFCMTILGD